MLPQWPLPRKFKLIIPKKYILYLPDLTDLLIVKNMILQSDRKLIYRYTYLNNFQVDIFVRLPLSCAHCRLCTENYEKMVNLVHCTKCCFKWKLAHLAAIQNVVRSTIPNLKSTDIKNHNDVNCNESHSIKFKSICIDYFCASIKLLNLIKYKSNFFHHI